MSNSSKYKITGRTFELKAKIIKAGGKWDSAIKCWTADLFKSDSIFRYDGRLTFTPVNDRGDRHDDIKSGYCNLCHSYCFGDCTS